MSEWSHLFRECTEAVSSSAQQELLHSAYLQVSGGNFSCSCANGYIGERCEMDVGALDCQQSPCMNGGTCFSITNGYRCQCTQFYEVNV